ncbi:TrmB family transcriptional regulator [Desertibaculum subflavum]|uniref:TrmB family transcriptional regulator n=1 Tax=Desertibaculum subflavum TaxID=2268458 RepID=UPI0013C45D3C
MPKAARPARRSAARAPNRLVAALQALGFTAYEAKAYRALIELGAPAKGYEIARAAQVPTSKIYETLGQLANRGAVLVSRSQPVTYAALPHRDLTARLRDQAEETLAAVEAELEALPEAPPSGLTWTVDGTDNVLEQMGRLIARAEHRLIAVLWDAQLAALAPALRQAKTRGLELQVAICGRFPLGIPDSYELTLLGAAAEERITGRRLAVIVRDDVEAIAAETYLGDTQAIRSESRVFALLAAECARSDILGRCMVDALGDAALQRLRRDRPALKTLLAPERKTEPLGASAKRRAKKRS